MTKNRPQKQIQSASSLASSYGSESTLTTGQTSRKELFPSHTSRDEPETILAFAMSSMSLDRAALKPKAKNLRRDIAIEFDRYFGNTSKVDNWVRLCRDVGIHEELRSIRQCKLVSTIRPDFPRHSVNRNKALKNAWVNIFDLIDAVATECTPPKRFESERALSKYTLETGRIFPKKKAKEGGPVRALLAHIFGPR